VGGTGVGVGTGVGEGLGDGVGPDDRTRSTWLPTPTFTPALGFVLITSPAGRSDGSLDTAPSCSFAD